jgi:uncharacterized protein YndB with AHSA1/START domain
MTRQKTFKKAVRARMDKTGESYTAARAVLLAGDEDQPSAGVPMAMSDEAIRRRSGQGWEHWFDLIDDGDMGETSHRDIAEWLRSEHGVPGWDSQSITLSYERARGGRAVGQKADGFAITASKTVNVPVERLFDAFTDPDQRRRWLLDGELSERTSNRPKGVRYDWADGSTRVVVGFEPKGPEKSVVALEHQRLPDAEEAERMKGYWRERVAELKQLLEA